MRETVLATHALTRDFRGFRAVDGVDLDVAAGSVHALVGPNGAGKTTLFNLLTGFLRPSAGRIKLDGRDITGLPPERVARLGVARSFQITTPVPAASPPASTWSWRCRPGPAGLAVLALGEAARPVPRTGPTSCSATWASPTRPRCRPTPWRTAASGPWNWPSRWPWTRGVLLLDEPTAGMGAEDVDRTVELIGRVRAGPHRRAGRAQHERGRAASPTGSPCCRPARVLVEGPYDEVRADPRVITAYLGAAACCALRGSRLVRRGAGAARRRPDRRAPARSSRWSAATAPASPRCCAA